MKLKKGRITILLNRDGMEINLIDNDSGTQFAVINLNQEQTCAALSRQGYVECDIELGGLEKLGKKLENKQFEFEIPDTLTMMGDDKLNEICLSELFNNNMEDWTPDKYYRSQNSFFNKDGKKYARVTIRRWI